MGDIEMTDTSNDTPRQTEIRKEYAQLASTEMYHHAAERGWRADVEGRICHDCMMGRHALQKEFDEIDGDKA